jgi:hypothetical protein
MRTEVSPPVLQNARCGVQVAPKPHQGQPRCIIRAPVNPDARRIAVADRRFAVLAVGKCADVTAPREVA